MPCHFGTVFALPIHFRSSFTFMFVSEFPQSPGDSSTISSQRLPGMPAHAPDDLDLSRR